MSVELHSITTGLTNDMLGYFFQHHAAEYNNVVRHVRQAYPVRPPHMTEGRWPDWLARLERIAKMHVAAANNTSEPYANPLQTS